MKIKGIQEVPYKKKYQGVKNMEDKELFLYIQQQEEGWVEKLIESLNLQEVKNGL